MMMMLMMTIANDDGSSGYNNDAVMCEIRAL